MRADQQNRYSTGPQTLKRTNVTEQEGNVTKSPQFGKTEQEKSQAVIFKYQIM
jgi:hypothetical protein